MDNIIEVKDLVKVYNGSIRAVDGISFHVERGEVFGFLGPNGAGKSTTIKVLTTLLQKTAGTASVDGLNVDSDAAAVRKIIGYASQEVSVDDDPTTGLDPQNRVAMWEYIQNLNKQGTTIFLTTQYMEEADRLADRLCIVDQGKIVAEGTPASLKAEIGADVIELALKENGETSARARARSMLEAVQGVQEIREVEGGVMVFAKNGPSLVPE